MEIIQWYPKYHLARINNSPNDIRYKKRDFAKKEKAKKYYNYKHTHTHTYWLETNWSRILSLVDRSRLVICFGYLIITKKQKKNKNKTDVYELNNKQTNKQSNNDT